MNKNTFLADPNVQTFIAWAIKKLPDLNIHLQIRRSRFVPLGVSVNAKGINDVLQEYMWKSTGMVSGDWSETVSHLTTLSTQLRDAVNSTNNEAVLKACEAILAWGGNRNSKIGAYPFLREQPNLSDYILGTGNAFILETADLSKLAAPNGPVGKMNAMLTKVHALFSRDGLPIYDSRVAAAIASLVELWRHDTGKTSTELPAVLSFPATVTTRTVLNLFPNAHHPGVMPYGSAGDTITAAQWSSAKVRLGWLMKQILDQSNLLDKEANRMHAFEATLFMIGYDVTCLGDQNISSIKSASEKKVRQLQNTLVCTEIPNSAPTKTLYTLGGKSKTEINYSGNLLNGFRIKWGRTKIFLEPSVLEELVSEFEGRKKVPLGAEQNGTGPFDSLGVWLKDAHKISPRFASAIAPILVEIKIISSHTGMRPILLNFVKSDVE